MFRQSALSCSCLYGGGNQSVVLVKFHIIFFGLFTFCMNGLKTMIDTEKRSYYSDCYMSNIFQSSSKLYRGNLINDLCNDIIKCELIRFHIIPIRIVLCESFIDMWRLCTKTQTVCKRVVFDRVESGWLYCAHYVVR